MLPVSEQNCRTFIIALIISARLKEKQWENLNNLFVFSIFRPLIAPQALFVQE